MIIKSNSTHDLLSNLLPPLEPGQSHISDRYIRGLPTFDTIIAKIESSMGVCAPQWPREYISQLQLIRVNQILSCARRSRFFRNLPERISKIDELSSLPILSRQEYADYMNPEKNLGFPFGYHDVSTWSVGSSGGTTSGPIFTRLPKRESTSLVRRAARSTLYWLNQNSQIKSFWNTLPRKLYFNDRSVYTSSDIRYCRGKARTPSEMIERMVNNLPNLMHGTPYSLRKQIQLMQRAAKIDKSLAMILHGVKYISYGGEFISQVNQEAIQQILPDAVFVSRYVSSQTGDGFIANNWPGLPHGIHLIDDTMAIIRIVDRNGQSVADGEWGSIAITNLHSLEQPIPSFYIGDIGKIHIDSGTGQRFIEIIGREDDIAIINTQKIYVKPMLDLILDNIARTMPAIRTTGIVQMIRTTRGSYKVMLEACNVHEPTELKLTEALTHSLRKQISLVVNHISTTMLYSGSRTLENFQLDIWLTPENSIPRKGVRSKVRMFVDENL